jgi:hypothetical protein
VARNHPRRTRPAQDAISLPKIALPDFPLPAGAHAWQDWYTRRELRRRLYRCLRRLGWLLGGYLVAFLGAGVAAAALPGDAADGVIAPLVLAMLAAVPMVVAAGFGVLAVVRMWFFLVRYPWRAYGCRYVTVGGEARIDAARLTVTDPDSPSKPRYLKVWANRRRRTLRGMLVPEVWIAGDLRRGVLVKAGGGELFLFRRDRARERALARYAGGAARRPKPLKVRQLSPRQQAKAQQRAEARVRAAAAATARLNRSRWGGQPLPGVRGQRLLGAERTGGIFRRK